jgi:hypothetical protein
MPLMKLEKGLNGPFVVNTDDIIAVTDGPPVEVLMRGTDRRFQTTYQSADEVAAELDKVENIVGRNVTPLL